MTKIIITPQNNTYTLAIPNKYIGKKIEIVVHELEEVVEEKIIAKKTMADFSNILSETDYQSLKEHTEKARKEWNRPI